MQQPSKLQISDLETVESVVDQEITFDEAEKIVGGLLLDCPYFPEADPPYPPINDSIEIKI